MARSGNTLMCGFVTGVGTKADAPAAPDGLEQFR